MAELGNQAYDEDEGPDPAADATRLARRWRLGDGEAEAGEFVGVAVRTEFDGGATGASGGLERDADEVQAGPAGGAFRGLWACVYNFSHPR